MDSVTLSPQHSVLVGRLPASVLPEDAVFELLWQMHPDAYHTIHLHGRMVETPRWQQAYGEDYRYTGVTNRALPIADAMKPMLQWSQGTLDARLNGLLFNWYDGRLGHYIGAHRDSENGRIPGTDIVTISLGETRTFRMRPYKGRGSRDFSVDHGSVLVIPWETNRAFTHEVTKSKRATGRRISITLRAFTGQR